jgi:signal transduction histidine kinase
MIRKMSFEYRVTITYIITGAIWILFSDKLVIAITQDLHQIQMISTYKGWFYVLVTGILLFILVRNETRRRNDVQNQLIEANKKAIESDNLKTAFLLNLNHYIRTPMNTILGFIDLIDKKDLKAEKQEMFLKTINQRSHQLLQILSSIIELSKLQESQVEIYKTNFQVNEIISNIVNSMNLEIANLGKPIQVSSLIPTPDGFDEIYTDKEKLILILSHLANNAVSYTQKGEIKIGYTVCNNQIEFFIKDTGLGISLEKQKLLITHFMQNPGYTYMEGEGAGIGLFLSSRFAQLLGGKLWLESTGESGTEFRLNIPSK